MHYKKQAFSNFTRAIQTTSTCFRPDNEPQINTIFSEINQQGLLARGNGLSYSDCCVLDQGMIIDTSHLDHMLSFDASSGIATCQAAVTFADLFLLDPQFIPPVLPGTLHATIAGGIANDVHGKNNHTATTFGSHVEWLELQIGAHTFHCDRDENSELFLATIAGLGLTGVIKRVGLRLRKATRHVCKTTEKHSDFSSLMQRMQQEGVRHDYQVAWLDLLNTPRALLSFADHHTLENADENHAKLNGLHHVPKLPVRLITHWLMKQFNRAYYHHSTPNRQIMPLWQFNNPLDCITNWNRLYGKRGLLQFQAVFNANEAQSILNKLITLIHFHQAIATLAVLKYFTKPGQGLLSFVKPGFTLAIDFIHNQQAREAIGAMNQCITEAGGKIYLAKDLLLTREQFIIMYPQHEQFSEVRAKYNSPMRSDLSKRLGIR